MRRAQEIDLAVVAESARWGVVGATNFTKTHWLQTQAAFLTNWFPLRTDILIGQLRAAGLYPALDAPVLSPHGGLIPESLAVTMSAPTGAIYYTRTAPTPVCRTAAFRLTP